MNEIATTDATPMAADEELTSLHRLIGQLLREENSLRVRLAELDVEDAQQYDAPDDDPDLQQRQRSRLATEAARTQVLNRIRGAREALKHRERLLVEAEVERIRGDLNGVLDAMAAEATRVNDALETVADGLRKFRQHGQGLVQVYRGVRGRSMLTGDGHIAGGDLSALGHSDNLRFAVEAHLAGCVPEWRTDHGATGNVAQRLGGQISNLRASIDMLLSQDAIRDSVAPDVVARVEG